MTTNPAKPQDKLAKLEAKLAEHDAKLLTKQKAKDAAAGKAEALKDDMRKLNAARDPIARQADALRREIGVAEGRPTTNIGRDE